MDQRIFFLAVLVITWPLAATPIIAQSIDRSQIISVDAISAESVSLFSDASDWNDSAVATKYPVVIAPHWGLASEVSGRTDQG